VTAAALSIRSVEAIPLRIPFGQSFTMAAPHQPTRGSLDVVVVRIAAEDGQVGVGETQAWRRQGSGETLAGLVGLIRDSYAPVLADRRVLDIAGTLSDLDAMLPGNLYALAAVSDALYDLAARSLGLPLYDLLGGLVRRRIPVGLSIGISGDPEATLAACEQAVALGYQHLRIKIGLDPDCDLRTIAKLRAHYGDRVVLRADANGGMAYGDALRLLARLEAFDLDIVEQPVADWDLEGMAALARAVRIPISADESLTTTQSLVEIARRGAARVVQTKTAKNGGIHYIRQLWTLADAFGIGIFPGNHPSTGINVAAVAHLAAAWPGRLLVGDFQTGAAGMIAEDILAEPVAVTEGHVVVPEGPGTGVVLDAAKLDRYRLDRS
jgi:muconate cycloisomerase